MLAQPPWKGFSNRDQVGLSGFRLGYRGRLRKQATGSQPKSLSKVNEIDIILQPKAVIKLAACAASPGRFQAVIKSTCLGPARVMGRCASSRLDRGPKICQKCLNLKTVLYNWRAVLKSVASAATLEGISSHDQVGLSGSLLDGSPSRRSRISNSVSILFRNTLVAGEAALADNRITAWILSPPGELLLAVDLILADRTDGHMENDIPLSLGLRSQGPQKCIHFLSWNALVESAASCQSTSARKPLGAMSAADGAQKKKRLSSKGRKGMIYISHSNWTSTDNVYCQSSHRVWHNSWSTLSCQPWYLIVHRYSHQPSLKLLRLLRLCASTSMSFPPRKGLTLPLLSKRIPATAVCYPLSHSPSTKATLTQLPYVFERPG